MLISETVGIFGVATSNAFEIVESLNRLNLTPLCIDNIGNADSRLPNLVYSADVNTPITIGPASIEARYHSSLSAFKDGFMNLTKVIDPTSVVADSAQISHGVYINALVTIASNAEILCNSIVNRSASIGHDCQVEQYASIGPGAVLAGNVKIGIGVFVGAGAVILPKVQIGARAIVGAGAVVVRDVEPNTVVVGNPARALKVNEQMDEFQLCPWH